MGRQRRITIGLLLVAVACALFAPLVSVGLYVVATALILALPLLRLGRSRHRASLSKP
jgi:fucose permease